MPLLVLLPRLNARSLLMARQSSISPHLSHLKLTQAAVRGSPRQDDGRPAAWTPGCRRRRQHETDDAAAGWRRWRAAAAWDGSTAAAAAGHAEAAHAAGLSSSSMLPGRREDSTRHSSLPEILMTARPHSNAACYLRPITGFGPMQSLTARTISVCFNQSVYQCVIMTSGFSLRL